jgi:hypothetical protein
LLSKSNKEERQAIINSISDTTGHLDIRFTLWRRFCFEHDISVDSLPSELSSEKQKSWKEFKDRYLNSRQNRAEENRQ